jgi:predicted PurR-regulated permease PerM
MPTQITPSQLPPPQPNRRQVFETAATFAIVIALLYFGGGILVPLVLAILLAFALTPLVDLLGRRLHLPDPVAVIVAVLIALIALGSFGYLVGTQLVGLAHDFPKYQATVLGKIRAVQSGLGNADFVEQVISAYKALFQQFNGAASSAAPSGQQPIPVTVSNEGAGPIGLLSSFLGSVLAPLATAAIVTVFLIFLLLGRGDLRDRFFRLVSQGGGYSATTRAIGDASARLGRYLLMQLAVNATYGTIFGTGLMLIGVPGAMLWGLMIALFRYIPYVGALIVAIIPFMLAFAVDPGWGMLAMTVGLYLALDLTTSNLIEPRLYGSSTGVSPLALLLAAMFWATLWGPIGLILSTPMTVCLVVLGRYVPQFKLFDTLLGSEPVLHPAERFYQRLLKGDTVEAIEIADETVATDGQDAMYDTLLLPALRLAAEELSASPESLPQRRDFATGIEAVIDEYRTAAPVEGNAPVLLLGGRTEFDEDAAHIVAQRLAGRGIASRVLPSIAARPENIARLDLTGTAVICLCFVGDNVRAQTRYIVRRLRRIDPRLVFVAAILDEHIEESPETLHVERIARSFASALSDIEGVLDISQGAEPPAITPETLFGVGRGDAALDKALEEIADALGVPLATVSLLAGERSGEDAEAFKLTHAIATSGEPLVIHMDGTARDQEANAYLLTSGVSFYAGVPLRLAGGEVIGALAILDYQSHEFDEDDLAALKTHAEKLVERFAHAVETPA